MIRAAFLLLIATACLVNHGSSAGIEIYHVYPTYGSFGGGTRYDHLPHHRPPPPCTQGSPWAYASVAHQCSPSTPPSTLQWATSHVESCTSALRPWLHPRTPPQTGQLGLKPWSASCPLSPHTHPCPTNSQSTSPLAYSTTLPAPAASPTYQIGCLRQVVRCG